jgi:Spy/CpxP family protein refolding chaperone
MHHPVIGMLMANVAEVIKPEQKATIDGIQADLEKLGDATKDARAQLDADIADGATAGKLDKAKIDADMKKLVQAADSTAAAAQEAVNKLHKTLDAAQRKKLVELLRAKGKEHEERMKSQMDEHEKGEHGRMDKIGEHLGLTPDQQKKLKTKLEASIKGDMGKMKEHHGGMQKHMKALGDAFESEKFDAKKAGVGEHMGDMAKMMANGKLHFVEAVLSVLTPEQRAKFAEHVKQHANDED